MEKIQFKEIHRLAIPALFAGIVEPLISLTDTAVAGHFTVRPEISIAAIGLVGAFLSALYWVFGQSSNAISSLVSKALGKNQLQTTKGLTASLLFWSACVGIVLAHVFYGFTDAFFALYGVDEEVAPLAKDYFRIRVWGLPFTMSTFLLMGAFRGLQNTKWTLWVALIGGITNIVLDFGFVVYFDWGTIGIAYASLIAQTAMFVAACFIWLRHAKDLGYFHRITHPKLPLALGMVLNLVLRAFALNFGLQYALYAANSLGKTELAVQNILVQVWLFSSFLLDGYAHAGNALGGKLYGANSIQNLGLLEKKLRYLMLGIGLFVGCLYGFFDTTILGIFTDATGILQLGTSIFIWIAITQPINAMAFLMDGLYKGMGKTIYLRNVFFVATFLVFCPLIYMGLQFEWGLHGLWFAFGCWMLARYMGLMFNFKKRILV